MQDKVCLEDGLEPFESVAHGQGRKHVIRISAEPKGNLAVAYQGGEAKAETRRVGGQRYRAQAHHLQAVQNQLTAT